MRLRNYREHKKPQLMIIPMIDIIFFLLVFFMLSMLSMVEQKGLPVNLPQAAASQEQMTKNIVLTVSKDDQLYFNKEAMPLDLLGKRLEAEQQGNPQVAVVLNADKEAKHGWVVKVLDIVKQSGVTKLAIATEAGE